MSVTDPGPPPQRVRVTSSRRGAIRARSRPIARDLDEQTGLGDVYLGGLMRAQLRLSLLVIGVGVLAVGGFPLLLLAVPSTRSVALFGLPFPWIVLGLLFYPAVWFLARWYTRQCERIEAEFADIVGSS